MHLCFHKYLEYFSFVQFGTFCRQYLLFYGTHCSSCGGLVAFGHIGAHRAQLGGPIRALPFLLRFLMVIKVVAIIFIELDFA